MVIIRLRRLLKVALLVLIIIMLHTKLATRMIVCSIPGKFWRLCLVACFMLFLCLLRRTSSPLLNNVSSISSRSSHPSISKTRKKLRTPSTENVITATPIATKRHSFTVLADAWQGFCSYLPDLEHFIECSMNFCLEHFKLFLKISVSCNFR